MIEAEENLSNKNIKRKRDEYENEIIEPPEEEQQRQHENYTCQ
ncbi:unnamed protein product, partial [Rotaria magnacalcarata]